MRKELVVVVVDPSISGTVEARNVKFDMNIDHEGH